MRYSLRVVLYFQVLLAMIIVFCACKQDPAIVRLEVLEIFRVEGDDSSKKPTVLRYKDVKNYDDQGVLVQQNFYKVDNTLKGYEFIKKQDNTGVTNYYDADSTLLAIYEMEYDGNRVVRKTGFDGSTRELLRTETYQYDSKGRLRSKAILDQTGALSNSFSMEYDSNGNEILFKMEDAFGVLKVKENFVIAKTNADKQWTERWGYINDVPNSFHRRSFSYETK